MTQSLSANGPRNAICELTDPIGQEEVEMLEQREILKQEVMDLVNNFIANKGGITAFDLQMLFSSSPDLYGCNEVYSALRLNVIDQMDQVYKNPG